MFFGGIIDVVNIDKNLNNAYNASEAKSYHYSLSALGRRDDIATIL